MSAGLRAYEKRGTRIPSVMGPSEKRVADCLLKAMTTKETAKELGIQPKTVEKHRLALKRRHGARNLVDLALKLAGVA